MQTGYEGPYIVLLLGLITLIFLSFIHGQQSGSVVTTYFDAITPHHIKEVHHCRHYLMMESRQAAIKAGGNQGGRLRQAISHRVTLP
jgi:hypothetical protein